MPARLSRQLNYLLQRHLLRRRMLLADGLPLDMKFRVFAADDVGRRLFKRRVHEAHVLQVLQHNAPDWRDAVAIDAGANLGWYSVLLARLSASQARVLAFEPEPANRALLQENLALNGADTVEVVPAALSDHAGTATLHRYAAKNLGRHALRAEGHSGTAIEVPLLTLDEALAQRGLERQPIAVLKADVEGHEPELLRGAAAALQRTQVLLMEYSPMYYQAAAAREMLESLAADDLRPTAWLNGQWQPVTVAQLLVLTVQCDTCWTRSLP
jgi:FkbM family methyltransferase